MYKNKETVSVEFKQNRKSHPIENVQPHWREKKRGKLNRLHFNERSVSVPKFQFSLVGQCLIQPLLLEPISQFEPKQPYQMPTLGPISARGSKSVQPR